MYRQGSRVAAERPDGKKGANKFSFFKKFSNRDDDEGKDDDDFDDVQKGTKIIAEHNREQRYLVCMYVCMYVEREERLNDTVQFLQQTERRLFLFIYFLLISFDLMKKHYFMLY